MKVTSFNLAHFDLPSWSTRMHGIQEKSKTVVLKNHRWPGAFTVSQQGTFFNIYLGNGIKDFTPDLSIHIPFQEDASNVVEEVDPNPEDEKKTLAEAQPEEEPTE
eukprot:NODE_43_length_33755_cov_1.178542.p38 type:complete len:105 gc:universal NODE_43_length_33755_cov_1.178542:8108-7794(-)